MKPNFILERIARKILDFVLSLHASHQFSLLSTTEIEE